MKFYSGERGRPGTDDGEGDDIFIVSLAETSAIDFLAEKRAQLLLGL